MDGKIDQILAEIEAIYNENEPEETFKALEEIHDAIITYLNNLDILIRS